MSNATSDLRSAGDKLDPVTLEVIDNRFDEAVREMQHVLSRTGCSRLSEIQRVIAEAVVQLAAGAGENGGRYQAAPEGDGYTEYSRSTNS